jgi:hypothetical protein
MPRIPWLGLTADGAHFERALLSPIATYPDSFFWSSRFAVPRIQFRLHKRQFVMVIGQVPPSNALLPMVVPSFLAGTA